jgi:hypothetical protein
VIVVNPDRLDGFQRNFCQRLSWALMAAATMTLYGSILFRPPSA